MAEGIKLNLGCGGKILKGFVNVDLANNWSDKQPDVVADLSEPLPFPDAHADEIHAYHVVEHFHRWQIPDILTDWVRVIKPGGILVLEMPCLDKIVGIYAHHLIDGTSPDPRLTIMGLFGDPAYKSVEMTHKWCYSIAEMVSILGKLGLEDIQEQQPKTHQPARDMRMIAKKQWQRIILT